VSAMASSQSRTFLIFKTTPYGEAYRKFRFGVTLKPARETRALPRTWLHAKRAVKNIDDLARCLVKKRTWVSVIANEAMTIRVVA
jgi:hypothetical protein